MHAIFLLFLEQKIIVFNGNSSMTVDVTSAVDPITTLGFHESIRQKINISEQWSDKTISFVANHSMRLSSGGARMLFDMGGSTPGWIELDNIEFFPDATTLSLENFE